MRTTRKRTNCVGEFRFFRMEHPGRFIVDLFFILFFLNVDISIPVDENIIKKSTPEPSLFISEDHEMWLKPLFLTLSLCYKALYFSPRLSRVVSLFISVS